MSPLTPATAPAAERFPWAAMSALGLAVFACVSSEFLPTGMLPEMSADLGVSTSYIGFLVTVWAITVVVVATPLSLVTRRFSRTKILIAAVILFGISNVVAAVSMNYETLFAARVIGGFSNAMFWMVATAYVSHLLPPRLQSRGILFISAGANLAFIVGLPLGSVIATNLNWRMGFVVMAALTVCAAILLAVFLKPVDQEFDADDPESRAPWRDRTFPTVAIVGVITLMTVAAHNIFYPYIKPFLISVANFSAVEAGGVLGLYGIGGVVGIVVAWILGRDPGKVVRNLGLAILFLGATMVATLLAAPSPVVVMIAMMAWSAAFSIADPLYGQLMMMSAGPRIRDFAGALRTTSWNLGIGSGAFVGGLVLVPWGLSALPLIGAAVAVCAAAVTLAMRTRTTPATPIE